jgi:hypothetical protein
VTSDTLVLSFDPAPSSYAFINAFEVVSMPADLYSDDASLLGQGGDVTTLGLPDSAIQAMYHINVGGVSVSPQNDSTGVWLRLQGQPVLYPLPKLYIRLLYPSTSLRRPSMRRRGPWVLLRPSTRTSI